MLVRDDVLVSLRVDVVPGNGCELLLLVEIREDTLVVGMEIVLGR